MPFAERTRLTRDKAALAVVGQHIGHYEESKAKPRQLSATQRAMIDAGLWDEPEPEESDSIFHEGTGRLRLAQLRIWSPEDSTTGKVDIEEIENEIVRLDRIFQFQVGADPWQAAYLIERLQKQNVPIEAVNFTGESLKSMCSATLESFREQQIDLFPEPQLLADLRSLRVVEKSYGVRLESPRGTNGHGDAATALAIALHLLKSNRSALARNVSEHKLVVYP